MSIIGQTEVPHLHNAVALAIANHLPRHLQDTLLLLPQPGGILNLPPNIDGQFFSMTGITFVPDMTFRLVRLVDNIWTLTALGARVNAIVLQQRQRHKAERSAKLAAKRSNGVRALDAAGHAGDGAVLQCEHGALDAAECHLVLDAGIRPSLERPQPVGDDRE